MISTFHTLGLDIIKRWVEVENTGSAPISFERLFSAGFSLPGMDPYTFENTNGAWGGEFLPCRTVLDGGNLVYESHRGASNHNQSPYFIAHRGATETRGAVYFGSLAYSGNFKVIAGRDLYGITRVSLGMNDPAGVLRQDRGIGRNVSPNEPLLLGTSVAVPIPGRDAAGAV